MHRGQRASRDSGAEDTPADIEVADSVSADDIPAEVLEREKSLAKAQAIEQGKPENIAEKMVTGKLRKFCQLNCLLEQPFIKDEDRTVKQVLAGTTVTAFVRYSVGETAAPAATQE